MLFLKYYGVWTVIAIAEVYCLVRYCASHEAEEKYLNRAMVGLIPFVICYIISTIFMCIFK